MTPRVSVIIPTFNRARCLPDAVRSVLAQTYDDLEVVVVDDGSTDDTSDVLRRLSASDSRVRSVHQANRGISAAMNLGLRTARGELIARLDSDDVWLPELLATEVAALDAEPDAGVVYSRAKVFCREGMNHGEIWGSAPRFPESHLASMLYGDFTCNITVMARRECLLRIGGYDESLRTSEDYDVWLRASVAHRFVFVDRVLAEVRVQSDSISVDNDRYDDNRRDRERVLDKLFAQPDLPSAGRAAQAIAYGNFYVESAIGYWARARRGRALDALRKAVERGDDRARAMARFGFFALVEAPLRTHPEWRKRVEALRHLVRRVRVGGGPGYFAARPLRRAAWLRTLASETGPEDVTVVIGVRDRKSYLLPNALRTVRGQDWDPSRVHVTVVDYGSDPAHRQWLSDVCAAANAQVITVHAEGAWNKSHCYNIAIARARTRYLLSMDADILLAPDYLRRAIERLRENPLGVVLAPAIWDLPEGWTERWPNFDHIGADDVPRLRALAERRREDGVDHLNTGINMARTALYHAVHGYDEAYVGWGAEDDDLVKRLCSFGAECVMTDSYYLHQWHPRFAGYDPAWLRAQLARNRQRLYATHTVVRNAEGWGRPERPSAS